MVRPRATWAGPPRRQEALRCGGSAEWPQNLEHRPGLAADNCPSRKPDAHNVVLAEKTGKLSGLVCSLTFELTGPRRWDGLARAGENVPRTARQGQDSPPLGVRWFSEGLGLSRDASGARR